MTPGYKLYHGVVFAELIHKYERPLTIEELMNEGRLSSYILNGKVGLQIKYASQRLHPWVFTLTRQNLAETLALRRRFSDVYVAFVCHTDGIACLSVEELASILNPGASDQGWIRIDRSRRQWYTVFGGAARLPYKKPNGLEPVIETLQYYDCAIHIM